MNFLGVLIRYVSVVRHFCLVYKTVVKCSIIFQKSRGAGNISLLTQNPHPHTHTHTHNSHPCTHTHTTHIHSLPSFFPSRVSLCTSLPSRDYLPPHPAATTTLPRECLQPCSNQSEASSSTTCTHGSTRMKREGEQRGRGGGEDG